MYALICKYVNHEPLIETSFNLRSRIPFKILIVSIGNNSFNDQAPINPYKVVTFNEQETYLVVFQ